MLPDDTMNSPTAAQEGNSNDFTLRSPAMQKTFPPKHATSIVARVGDPYGRLLGRGYRRCVHLVARCEHTLRDRRGGIHVSDGGLCGASRGRFPPVWLRAGAVLLIWLPKVAVVFLFHSLATAVSTEAGAITGVVAGISVKVGDSG